MKTQITMGEGLRSYRPALTLQKFTHYLTASRLLLPNLQETVIQSGVELTDVSYWQGMIDFLKMSITGIVGTVIRAGQNTWQDINFKTNWANAKKYALPRGSYWLYDSRSSPKDQADLYTEIIGHDRGELMLTADYEENYKGPHAGWGKLYDFLERLKSNGIPESKIWIYTGFWYWLDHSPQNDLAALRYFSQYPLWLASYTAKPANVRIPKPWLDALLWQYGTPPIGIKKGVSSKEIDMNSWTGDIAHYLKYWGFASTTPPPSSEPPPPLHITIRRGEKTILDQDFLD